MLISQVGRDVVAWGRKNQDVAAKPSTIETGDFKVSDRVILNPGGEAIDHKDLSGQKLREGAKVGSAITGAGDIAATTTGLGAIAAASAYVSSASSGIGPLSCAAAAGKVADAYASAVYSWLTQPGPGSLKESSGLPGNGSSTGVAGGHWFIADQDGPLSREAEARPH